MGTTAANLKPGDEGYGTNRVEVRVPLVPKGSDIPCGWYNVWVHPDNVEDLWSKIDRSVASSPSGNVTVLPIDTEVELSDGIRGKVTAFCVRESGYITYEVQWWADRTRHSGWFAASQCRPVSADGPAQTVGFNSNSHSPS